MTISSLSALPYTSLLTNQSSSTNSASSSAGSSGSIGDQLLAALAQAQSSSGTATDPLAQELVTLSPAALGQASTTPQTYNAQGLLQQVQSSMLLNDPFFQTDTTDTSNTISNSLLQSLISSHQTPATASEAAGTANTAASPQTPTNTGNAQSQAAATAAGSADPNANWAQLLKQNPSLASELVQSQTDHGLISMLGQ